jgi:hypothetical protein
MEGQKTRQQLESKKSAVPARKNKIIIKEIHRDGWLSRGRWMAKLAARLLASCYGSSLGSNLDISQKYKGGDKSKGLAHKTNIEQIMEKLK